MLGGIPDGLHLPAHVIFPHHSNTRLRKVPASKPQVSITSPAFLYLSKSLIPTFSPGLSSHFWGIIILTSNSICSIISSPQLAQSTIAASPAGLHLPVSHHYTHSGAPCWPSSTSTLPFMLHPSPVGLHLPPSRDFMPRNIPVSSIYQHFANTRLAASLADFNPSASSSTLSQ